jgi:hypothetical protein
MNVKTIEEIRRANFSSLVAEAGGVSKFAEKMTKSQSQFSQIINKSPDSKTGKPKEIGSKLAREIEQRLGKEIGWMDHEPEEQEFAVFKRLPPAVRSWIMENAQSLEKKGETSEQNQAARSGRTYFGMSNTPALTLNPVEQSEEQRKRK